MTGMDITLARKLLSDNGWKVRRRNARGGFSAVRDCAVLSRGFTVKLDLIIPSDEDPVLGTLVAMRPDLGKSNHRTAPLAEVIDLALGTTARLAAM